MLNPYLDDRNNPYLRDVSANPYFEAPPPQPVYVQQGDTSVPLPVADGPVYAQPAPPPEYSEFGKGLRQGVRSFAPAIDRTQAAVQGALGFEQAAQANLAEAQAAEQRLEQNQALRPRIARFRDAQTAGDYVDWGLYNLGAQAPLMGAMATTGLAGGAVGALAGAGRAVGAASGMLPYLNTTVSETSQRIFQDPNAQGTLQEKSLGALAGGVAQAAVGAVPFARVAGAIARPAASLAGRMGQAALTGAVTEGATEGFEEAIGKLTHQQFNPQVELNSREAWLDYLDAAAGGALVGGAFGGGGALVSHPFLAKAAQRDPDGPMGFAQKHRRLFGDQDLKTLGSLSPEMPRSKLQAKMWEIEDRQNLDVAYNQILGLSRQEVEAERQRRQGVLERLGRQWYRGQDLDAEDPNVQELVRNAPDNWQDILDSYVNTRATEWAEEDRRQMVMDDALATFSETDQSLIKLMQEKAGAAEWEKKRFGESTYARMMQRNPELKALMDTYERRVADQSIGTQFVPDSSQNTVRNPAALFGEDVPTDDFGEADRINVTDSDMAFTDKSQAPGWSETQLTRDFRLGPKDLPWQSFAVSLRRKPDASPEEQATWREANRQIREKAALEFLPIEAQQTYQEARKQGTLGKWRAQWGEELGKREYQPVPLLTMLQEQHPDLPLRRTAEMNSGDLALEDIVRRDYLARTDEKVRKEYEADPLSYARDYEVLNSLRMPNELGGRDELTPEMRELNPPPDPLRANAMSQRRRAIDELEKDLEAMAYKPEELDVLRQHSKLMHGGKQQEADALRNQHQALFDNREALGELRAELSDGLKGLKDELKDFERRENPVITERPKKWYDATAKRWNEPNPEMVRKRIPIMQYEYAKDSDTNKYAWRWVEKAIDPMQLVLQEMTYKKNIPYDEARFIDTIAEAFESGLAGIFSNKALGIRPDFGRKTHNTYDQDGNLVELGMVSDEQRRPIPKYRGKEKDGPVVDWMRKHKFGIDPETIIYSTRGGLQLRWKDLEVKGTERFKRILGGLQERYVTAKKQEQPALMADLQRQGESAKTEIRKGEEGAQYVYERDRNRLIREYVEDVPGFQQALSDVDNSGLFPSEKAERKDAIYAQFSTKPQEFGRKLMELDDRLGRDQAAIKRQRGREFWQSESEDLPVYVNAGDLAKRKDLPPADRKLRRAADVTPEADPEIMGEDVIDSGRGPSEALPLNQSANMQDNISRDPGGAYVPDTRAPLSVKERKRWARTVPEGTEHYELSTKGDARFSPFKMKFTKPVKLGNFQIKPGMTLNDARQQLLAENAGIYPEELYPQFKAIVKEWLNEEGPPRQSQTTPPPGEGARMTLPRRNPTNRELVEDMRRRAAGRPLTDAFTPRGGLSPARVFADLFEEMEGDRGVYANEKPPTGVRVDDIGERKRQLDQLAAQLGVDLKQSLKLYGNGPVGMATELPKRVYTVTLPSGRTRVAEPDESALLDATLNREIQRGASPQPTQRSARGQVETARNLAKVREDKRNPSQTRVGPSGTSLSYYEFDEAAGGWVETKVPLTRGVLAQDNRPPAQPAAPKPRSSETAPEISEAIPDPLADPARRSQDYLQATTTSVRPARFGGFQRLGLKEQPNTRLGDNGVPTTGEPANGLRTQEDQQAPNPAPAAVAEKPAEPSAPRVTRQARIARNDLKQNANTLYVFGDNDQRQGYGGQAAAMRGEPNAVGIRTKAKPLRGADAYWSDATYAENIRKIDEDMARLFAHQGPIVLPEAGIGTGLAELKQRAPKTFQYLQERLADLEQGRKPSAPQTKSADYIEVTIAKRNGRQIEADLSRFADATSYVGEQRIKYARSPWLSADGRVVSTGGDHIDYSDALGYEGYADLTAETGAVRTGLFVRDENNPEALITLHLLEGQTLTPAQKSTVERFVTAHKAQILLGVQPKRKDGSFHPLVNPEYQPVSLDQLPTQPQPAPQPQPQLSATARSIRNKFVQSLKGKTPEQMRGVAAAKRQEAKTANDYKRQFLLADADIAERMANGEDVKFSATLDIPGLKTDPDLVRHQAAEAKLRPADLQREERFANELLKKLGLQRTVRLATVAEAHAKRPDKLGAHGMKWTDADGTVRVYLNPLLSKAVRLETLGHELGHIVFKDALSQADARTQKAVKQAFEAWRDGAKASRSLKAIYDSKKTAALLDSLWGFDGQTLDSLSAEDQAYVLDFEEWFADNVGRWMVSDAKPVGLVQQFFKDVADLIRDLFRLLHGNVPDAAVKRFMDSLFVREEPVSLATTPGATSFTPAERKVLGQAFRAEHVQRQLRKLLENDPVALDQLRDPDAAIAYGYQFWLQGSLSVGPRTQTAFQRLLKATKDALGEVDEGTQAEAILRAPGGNAHKAQLTDTAVQRGYAKLKGQSAKLMEVLRKVAFMGHEQIKALDNPYTDRLAELIYNEAGTEGVAEGYLSAQVRQAGRFLDQLHNLFDGHDEALGQRVMDLATKRAPLSGANAEERRLVRGIYQLFADVLNYSKRAGVEPQLRGKDVTIDGETVRDYFPRVIDTDYLMAHKTEFLAMLNQPKYKDYVGDAEGIYRAYLENFGVESEFDPLADPSAPQASSFKKREFAWIEDEDIAPYLSRDLGETMSAYIHQTVKHSEWRRRFGGKDSRAYQRALADENATPAQLRYAEQNGKYLDLLEDARKTGLMPEQEERVTKYMEGMLGRLGTDINPTFNMLQSWMIVLQNWALLGMSAITSLADVAGLAVRGDIQVAWEGLKAGLNEVVALAKKDKTSLKALGEMLGTIERHTAVEALGFEYGGYRITEGARKWNDRLFRWNLLQSWTRGTRLMALASGKSFITKHVKDPGTHSQRFLDQLNLRKGDVQFDAKGDIRILTEAERKAASEAELKRDDRVRAALNQFVDEAILRPNAAERPVYFNDPHYMLFTHLKQWVYSFQSVILRRVVSEAIEGNYMPMVRLMGYVPLTMAAIALKDAIKGDDEDKDWATWIGEGVGRSGVMGYGQVFYDMMNDSQYGQMTGSSLLDPTSESMLDLLDALISAGSDDDVKAFERFLPLQSVWGG